MKHKKKNSSKTFTQLRKQNISQKSFYVFLPKPFWVSQPSTAATIINFGSLPFSRIYVEI